MHSPNYKKAVCLFFKPAFNLLNLLMELFLFCWGAWGFIALCSLSELVLQKVKHLVCREIAAKLVMSGYKVFI